MSYTIVKFGGSNLKNSNSIRNILTAIKEYNKPLVIVVSAFYGVTNKLEQAVFSAKNGKLEPNAFIEDIYSSKINLVGDLIDNESLFSEFKTNLRLRLSKLKDYFLGIKYINDTPDFLYDEILSYGERISSLSLLYILKDANIDCSESLPESMGLYTDGEFGNATVDFALSTPNLRSKLNKEKTYIVPGFYGISKEGKTCLLGRGGSDYSAAAIASCLDADYLDLWKDVEGFLSADPNIIKNAIGIGSLTYAEAAELAYFGSKILHPRTPEPLIDKKIPIRIFNILEAGKGLLPKTIVNGKSKVTEEVIKSVSYSDDFGIVKLKGSGVGAKPGILSKASTELDKKGINIKSVITSQTAINMLLSAKDLTYAKEVLSLSQVNGINEIEIIDNISVIAAVGEGITSQYGIAGKMFSAVARKKININIISFGASKVAAYFIVNKNERNSTVTEIHNEFFGNTN